MRGSTFLLRLSSARAVVLCAVFIGGELFHQSLTSFSDNGFPGKTKLGSFPSARILLAGPHCPHDRGEDSQVLDGRGLLF